MVVAIGVFTEVIMGCRFCGTELGQPFLDLGATPLANALLTSPNQEEPFFPLAVHLCPACWLVQLEQFATPETIFSHYVYFSSFSSSWLEHCRRYVADIIPTLGLTKQSQVVEIASNDGYLLKNFVDVGIPCLGIEPAANVAEIARQQGVETQCAFFSRALAAALVLQGRRADLIIANNVLAHVPELNDFVAGMAVLLKPGGVITIEVPHLLRLLQETQFDTIYHEHFSYFSAQVVQRVFAHHGLRLFHVEELATHGGSLRCHLCHHDDARAVQASVTTLLEREREAGLEMKPVYAAMAQRVMDIRGNLTAFFQDAAASGKRVAAYGAAAKGNTLLNTCGIQWPRVTFVADRNPHKQGLYLPGSHIPVATPERVMAERPDYLLILPWNLKQEIMAEMAMIREWGGRFVTAIPQVAITP